VTPAEEGRHVQAVIARELDGARWAPGAQPAGIYLRVSTKGQTVENQVCNVVAMAAARGYIVDVLNVFLEKESGAELERPEMQRAQLAAHRGRIRALFVWAIDRLSRDETFSGGVREIGEFDRYNCAIVSHEESYVDTSGPMRNTLVQFALKMAADERVRKNRRTQEAVSERVRAIREGRGFIRKAKRPGELPRLVTAWGRPPKYSPEVRAKVLDLNAAMPHLTVPMLTRVLVAQGVAVTRGSVRHWLDGEHRSYPAGPRFGASA
jgi:DNA invertase Pin-like site-specific DNA recombinase